MAKILKLLSNITIIAIAGSTVELAEIDIIFNYCSLIRRSMSKVLLKISSNLVKIFSTKKQAEKSNKLILNKIIVIMNLVFLTSKSSCQQILLYQSESITTTEETTGVSDKFKNESQD
ncbi:hypothetical protein [Spiroplasma endosymbiont of 'Nebria riversi']|uniref:hypothetical protein n=1 Tax=Spiroplasma endosymbiont of 'Nebria riversi' TaxID=2792084 RepID=UPI001C050BCA|nr:hypothetical protein [Spiroplasma endosymbiont of 'Nebria riversi']